MWTKLKEPVKNMVRFILIIPDVLNVDIKYMYILDILKSKTDYERIKCECT